MYFGVNCCDHHSNAVTHHNCFPYPELPLQILLINDSPRIVGRSVSVDVNVSKPTQSLTCHLRQVGQELSNVQDCESVCDSESLAYSCFHFAIHFHFLGSSLSITYPNLNSGKYVLRIVGRAVTGERAVLRTEFLIGNLYINNYKYRI